MYARLITAHVQPTKLEEFVVTLSEVIVPAISREHGFKSLYMMKDAVQNKITALVLWETESEAQASIEGYLSLRLPKMAKFLASEPGVETLEVVLRA